MAETNTTNTTGAGDTLQFDKAEAGSTAAPAASACTACNQQIAGEYYEAGGKVVCPTCRTAIEKSLTGGSGAGRWFKAFGMGSVAALLGTAIYYAVLKLTGYEFGLVAILVGFMVGWAVRQGSKGRGGWAYQTMAVILTYLSIVTTYVPYIIEGISQAEDGDAAALQAEAAEAAPAEVQPATPAQADASTPATAAGDDATAAADDGEAAMPQFSGPVAFLIGWILIMVVACAAPWLAGFQNVIGWVIIGFALYQAWSMNKKVNVEVTGPYQAAATTPAAP